MTKHILSASVSALVLAGVGSFAAAQTSSDTGLQQTSAPDLTCAQIAGLDATRTPHVLYYIKGFLAGQKESSSGATAAPSATGSPAPAAASGTTTGTDTAASGSATIPGTGTVAGAENQANTEGPAAAPSATGSPAPAAASGTTTGTDTAASGSATIPGTGTAAGAENQADTEAVAGPGSISGWSDINVEQVVADCRADSSASLSSILEKQAN